MSFVGDKSTYWRIGLTSFDENELASQFYTWSYQDLSLYQKISDNRYWKITLLFGNKNKTNDDNNNNNDDNNDNNNNNNNNIKL